MNTLYPILFMLPVLGIAIGIIVALMCEYPCNRKSPMMWGLLTAFLVVLGGVLYSAYIVLPPFETRTKLS